MEADCSAAFDTVGERAGRARAGTDRPKSTSLICRRLYQHTISNVFSSVRIKGELTELHANAVACALHDLEYPINNKSVFLRILLTLFHFAANISKIFIFTFSRVRTRRSLRVVVDTECLASKVQKLGKILGLTVGLSI